MNKSFVPNWHNADSMYTLAIYKSKLWRFCMDISEIALEISVALLDKLDYDFKFSDDKDAMTGHINTLSDLGARLYKTTLNKLNQP